MVSLVEETVNAANDVRVCMNTFKRPRFRLEYSQDLLRLPLRSTEPFDMATNRPQSKISLKKRYSLVEEKVRQAEKDGLFDNLSGKGKPLDLKEWRHTPPELRMGYSVFKSAGVAPQEVKLKGTIGTLKQEIRETNNPDLKKELIDALNKHMVDYAIRAEKATRRRR